jgi:hypothetical protein
MGNKLGKVSALSIDPEVGVADMPLMLGHIYRIATTRAVDPHWMYRSHLAVGRSLRITAWLYVGWEPYKASLASSVLYYPEDSVMNSG